MKTETIEDEIKFLKIDFNNLKNHCVQLEREIRSLQNVNEFFIHNMRILFKSASLGMEFDTPCEKCAGHGTVYIHPISDCGQSNTCTDCGGKGRIWSQIKPKGAIS